MMDVIYFTKNGYDLFLAKLSAKREEYQNVRNERAEALKESTESDLNDPVLVDLQQRESSLSVMINELEKTLVQSIVIEFDPENRSVDQVKIGSLVEILRVNVTADKELPIELWEIAGHEETNIKERLLSYNSPIGKCLVGGSEGDVISNVIIGDQEFEIEIVRLYKNWTSV